LLPRSTWRYFVAAEEQNSALAESRALQTLEERLERFFPSDRRRTDEG